MVPCTQCGKPAVVNVGGHPLCVDCNLKFQQASQMVDTRLKQQMNFLLDQAEALTGLYGVTPRYQIPRPLIQTGTFNNIRVDRSTIGAINTGYVGWIDTVLTSMASPTDAELKGALKEFTQAVISSTAVSEQVKNEILEQLTIVASQAGQPKERRKYATLKSLSAGVLALIQGMADLTTLWNNVRTLLGL